MTQGCQVQNPVDVFSDTFQGIRPGNISFNIFNAKFLQRLRIAAVPHEAAAVVAFTNKFFNQVGADKPSCSGY